MRLATHFAHGVISREPWHVTAPSLRHGTTQPPLLLYCMNPWLGVCQRYAANASRHRGHRLPRMVNPVLIGRMAALQRAHGGSARKLLSSGLAAVALALASCSR